MLRAVPTKCLLNKMKVNKMLITPPLAPKSPCLSLVSASRLLHAERAQWSFVLLPLLSAGGLCVADSQAGGQAVLARVSQAPGPAASSSCCFPPGASGQGGDPPSRGWQEMPPSACGCLFPQQTEGERETHPHEGTSSWLRAGREKVSFGVGGMFSVCLSA